MSRMSRVSHGLLLKIKTYVTHVTWISWTFFVRQSKCMSCMSRGSHGSRGSKNPSLLYVKHLKCDIYAIYLWWIFLQIVFRCNFSHTSWVTLPCANNTFAHLVLKWILFQFAHFWGKIFISKKNDISQVWSIVFSPSWNDWPILVDIVSSVWAMKWIYGIG